MRGITDIAGKKQAKFNLDNYLVGFWNYSVLCTLSNESIPHWINLVHGQNSSAICQTMLQLTHFEMITYCEFSELFNAKKTLLENVSQHLARMDFPCADSSASFDS